MRPDGGRSGRGKGRGRGKEGIPPEHPERRRLIGYSQSDGAHLHRRAWTLPGFIGYQHDSCHKRLRHTQSMTLGYRKSIKFDSNSNRFEASNQFELDSICNQSAPMVNKSIRIMWHWSSSRSSRGSSSSDSGGGGNYN